MSTSIRFQRIENIAQKHIDEGAFSNIEWLVKRKGKTWSCGSVGYSDALNKIPLPNKPIYRIYSMTKPIISAATLMLVEMGKLRLFDPVAAYLPEFANMSIIQGDSSTIPAMSPIIIEHLLTHRAGLSYGFLSDCPVSEFYRQSAINDANLSLETAIKLIADMPLVFEPGSRWQYSVATDVLARVLEVALGKKLPDILDELLLEPLEMVDTGFQIEASQQSRLLSVFGKSDLNEVMNYDDKPQTLMPSDPSDHHPVNNENFHRGGYGLYSTIDDYSLCVDFLGSGLTSRGERLLSSKMIELMWTNRIPDNQLPLRIGPVLLPGYGFGLAGRVMMDIGNAYGLTSQGECGWAGAASTYFWIDKKEDIVGLIMTQYLGSKIPIGDDIRNAVYQALDE